MSSPSCRPPLCRFNCCNQIGVCPTSEDGCYNPNIKNPIWLYLIIGIVIISIIVGAIIILIIIRKRRQRLEQKKAKQINKFNKQIVEQIIEIQMKQRQLSQSPNIQINKKSIYVYERQVKEKEQLKHNNDARSISSHTSRNRSNKDISVQNSFDAKSRIRSLLL